MSINKKTSVVYSQEKQNEYTQRAQPRELVKLGMWEQKNFIIAETVPLGHTVTWVKQDLLSQAFFFSSFA